MNHQSSEFAPNVPPDAPPDQYPDESSSHPLGQFTTTELSHLADQYINSTDVEDAEIVEMECGMAPVPISSWDGSSTIKALDGDVIESMTHRERNIYWRNLIGLKKEKGNDFPPIYPILSK